MRYKKIMMLTIILTCLLAVSAVSAAENVTDDIIGTDVASEDVVSCDNNKEIVASNNENISKIGATEDDKLSASQGTFTDFTNEVQIVNGKMVFNRDYKYDSLNDPEREYVKNLWNPSLIIDGQGHTIDGSFESHIFLIGGNNVTVKNIIFIDCFESFYWLGISDGVIDNCTFINTNPSSSSKRSTGIGFSSSNGVISNCKFINMTNAGIIGRNDATGTTIDNCTFINCTGYGAISWSGSNCIISNCIFINNTYTDEYMYRGGAITLFDTATNSIVVNSSFINNKGFNDKNSICWWANNGNIINCYFTPEDESIYLKGGNINISHAFLSIDSNNYSYGYGLPINHLVSLTYNDFPVPNKKILFKISNGDKIYNNYVTTDKNGFANISNILSKLDYGDWQVNASFEGDNYYYPCESVFTISIKHLPALNLLNITGTVGQKSTFIAYVNSNNLTINEGNMMFYINNRYLGSVPVVNGSASLNYTPTYVENYTVKAVFGDSDNFFGNENTILYNVLPGNSHLIIEGINASWDSETTFTAHVLSNNTLINEGTVSFYINDEFIGDALVDQGLASLTLEAPGTLGEHIISAIFNSNNYLGANDTAKLVVNSGDVDVSKYESVATFKELSKLIENTPEGSTLKLTKDFIYVSGSTEGIQINKIITIDGQGHVLDGNGEAKILDILMSGTVLRNIIFKNIYSSSSYKNGALNIGIFSSNCVIENCSFIDISVKFGSSAISCYGTNVIINNCSFINNSANSAPICIYGLDGHVTNCIFSNNTNVYGEIYGTQDRCSITNCSFINNDDGIGVIYFKGNENVLINSIFTNNYVRTYGCINWNGDEGILTNCSFINNSAQLSGGAIYWDGNYGIVTNCSFINNSALKNDGGAIYWCGAEGVLANCSFINNFAYKNGGAIFWDYFDGALTNCSFINNTALYYGGAIYKGLSRGEISNSIFTNNSALLNASAIFWMGTNGIIVNNTFVNNLHINQILWNDNGTGYISDCKFLINTKDNVVTQGAKFIKRYLNLTYYFSPFYYKHPVNNSIILMNILEDLPAYSSIFFNLNNNNFNQTFELNLKNNIAIIGKELSNLSVGIWNVTIVFEGDDNYYPCNATATITILPVGSSLIIDDVNTTVGHEITLVANVNSTLTINEGTITFFDGSTRIGESPVSEGIASLTYTPTTDGEHNITAIFSSGNYLSSKGTAKLLVDSVTIDILVQQGIVGFNSTFIAEVKGLYSTINEGTVTFYINDEYCGSVPVVNGYASIGYVPLNANTYAVKAVFGDSDKFLGDEDCASYVVNQADSEIIINDMNGTVGHDITISVNIISSKNLTINEGYVTFFDGEAYIDESNVYNGIATLTYTPPTAGEHNITAMFYGINYKDSINYAILNVSKAEIDLTIDDIGDVDFKKPSKFTVHVTSNSKPVNEGGIKFYVNDSFVGYSSISNSVASFEYAANGGSSVLTTIYEETDNYLTSSQTSNFVVNAIPSTLIVSDIAAYYNDDTYLLVQLVDSLGAPITGVKVLLYFDDVRTFITDNKGQIKASTNGLTPKSYVTKITFEGNANYTQTTTFINVVIHKSPSYIVMDDFSSNVGQELTVTANVVNYSNNLTINDGRVIFFDGATNIGESYIVNGSASITYTTLYAGNYVLKAVYYNSIYFTDNEKTTHLTVNKANSNLFIADLNGTVDHNVLITANITSPNKLTINEGYVVFYDGENQIGNSYVNNGVATLTYTPTTAGEHTITAMYYGTNYENNINSALLNVSKAEVSLTIGNIETVYFTNPSNFAVNVLANYKGISEGTIKYYVNGNYIGMSNVYDGKAATSFTTNATGSFDLFVVYNETDNYLSKNASATFYVDKIPTEITASGFNTVYNGDKYIVATLRDSDGNPMKYVKVTVKFSNGKTDTHTTNKKGIVQFSTNGLAPVKKYYATITFDGNAKYEQSTTTVKVKVYKATPKITAKAQKFKRSDKKKQYTIRLLTNQNIKMKYAKVYIKVNGKLYAAQTNKKGYATFSLKKLTKKGAYKAKIMYGGNSYYNALTTKVKLTVK